VISPWIPRAWPRIRWLKRLQPFYTFQGLTSDGNYYIAAVLPVTHPDLPDTQQVSAQQIDEVEDFRATLAKTVASLITPSI
jgi:hypothetical protein